MCALIGFEISVDGLEGLLHTAPEDAELVAGLCLLLVLEDSGSRLVDIATNSVNSEMNTLSQEYVEKGGDDVHDLGGIVVTMESGRPVTGTSQTTDRRALLSVLTSFDMLGILIYFSEVDLENGPHSHECSLLVRKEGDLGAVLRTTLRQTCECAGFIET